MGCLAPDLRVLHNDTTGALYKSLDPGATKRGQVLEADKTMPRAICHVLSFFWEML